MDTIWVQLCRWSFQGSSVCGSFPPRGFKKCQGHIHLPGLFGHWQAGVQRKKNACWSLTRSRSSPRWVQVVWCRVTAWCLWRLPERGGRSMLCEWWILFQSASGLRRTSWRLWRRRASVQRCRINTACITRSFRTFAGAAWSTWWGWEKRQMQCWPIIWIFFIFKGEAPTRARKQLPPWSSTTSLWRESSWGQEGLWKVGGRQCRLKAGFLFPDWSCSASAWSWRQKVIWAWHSRSSQDFILYLRPGEGLDIRGRNVVAPVKSAGVQYKWTTVIIRDQEGLRPDKVGVYDNSIPIDQKEVQWVGNELLRMKRKLHSQDDKIFVFTMEDFRGKFAQAGASLGIENLHPYQLRHGGATEDLTSKRRDHPQVKARGRWMTDQSVRRYTKIGRVQALLNKLSPANLRFCQWSEKHLQAVIQGQKPARSASSQWSWLMCLALNTDPVILPWRYLQVQQEFHSPCINMACKFFLSIFVYFLLITCWLVVLQKVFSISSAKIVSHWFGWACRALHSVVLEKRMGWDLVL